MATVADIWNWLKNPLYGALYSGASFDGEDGYTYPNNISTSPSFRPGFMGGQNRILGAIRFGQIRVNSVDCIVPDQISPGTTRNGDADAWRCTAFEGQYAATEESTTPFGYPSAIFTPRSYANEPGWTSPTTRQSYGPPTFSVLFPNKDPALSPSTLPPSAAFGGLPDKVNY